MIRDYTTSHIWIIGASSGIGHALARELSRRGAKLALSARRETELRKLNAELGGQHLVLPMDIANTTEISTAAALAQTFFPRIDSVIVMSAIYEPQALAALDLDSVRQIIAVNLTGTINVIHTLLPVLKAQKDGGQIALCGSVAGYRGLPNGQPYSATKAAIINLAESLRVEENKNKIDVRLISPGFVRTPMTDKNDFSMPMMIEPDVAARAIADGLQRRAFEIHFPRKFSYIMKILRLAPHRLFFQIAERFSGR